MQDPAAASEGLVRHPQRVMWELAHRPADSTESVRVVLEADTSADAIAQLRAQIPEGHLVLFVRSTDRQAPAGA